MAHLRINYRTRKKVLRQPKKMGAGGTHPLKGRVAYPERKVGHPEVKPRAG